MTNVHSVLLVLLFMAGQRATSSNAIGAQYQNLQPKPKQNIQQFQIAVVVPPGTQPQPGNQPPSPSSPEYVWLQVPASYFTSQSPPLSTPTPGIYEPPVPANPPYLPPVEPTQPPGIYQPPVPANPPYLPPGPPFLPPVSTTTTHSPISGEVLLRRCQKPRGQFPSRSCNKYVNCWDGTAVEQFCPEGLVFNPRGYCDYPENVDCGGRPIEGIPPPPTPSGEYTSAAPGQVSSEAPTTAAPPTVIVTLPTIDPSLRKLCLKPRGQFRSKECNKYVNCWDDVVIEQECPEGLYFSNKGYCDYPQNVDCSNSQVPPRSAIEVDSECPLESGTFRDKMNCSSYFTCIGGRVVARYSCPEGFSFNDNLGVCDHAYRVDCTREPLIFYPKASFLSSIPKGFMERIDQCKPGTVIPLNPQCTSACLCHEGGSEVVQCPNGLKYDTQTDKCVLPHLAKC